MGSQNQVREEYNVSELYTEEATNSTIFNQSMQSFIRAVTEGVNISVFTYGTSHAGKSHTI
jgi:hypothetical protein